MADAIASASGFAGRGCGQVCRDSGRAGHTGRRRRQPVRGGASPGGCDRVRAFISVVNGGGPSRRADRRRWQLGCRAGRGAVQAGVCRRGDGEPAARGRRRVRRRRPRVRRRGGGRADRVDGPNAARARDAGGVWRRAVCAAPAPRRKPTALSAGVDAAQARGGAEQRALVIDVDQPRIARGGFCADEPRTYPLVVVDLVGRARRPIRRPLTRAHACPYNVTHTHAHTIAQRHSVTRRRLGYYALSTLASRRTARPTATHTVAVAGVGAWAAVGGRCCAARARVVGLHRHHRRFHPALSTALPPTAFTLLPPTRSCSRRFALQCSCLPLL
mmetsp:Transcript_29550/g.62128  ORF Transcript_29550/g.62128 Transcript_29550/m.62128 type:complete len:330 (+) Transcript_29550:293-1282(+)